LRLQRPAFAQRNRVSAFQRSRYAMTIDIDALPFIRTRIAAIPCAHQHGIEIPALRADMRPVTAKAGAGYFEITHGKIIPAERLTCDIAGHTGIAKEQAEAVGMAAICFAAPKILTSLNAKKLAIKARCNCTLPLCIDILPKQTRPGRRQITAASEKILFATALVECSECCECQMMRHRRQGGVNGNLDAIKWNDIAFDTCSTRRWRDRTLKADLRRYRLSIGGRRWICRLSRRRCRRRFWLR